MSPLGLEPEHRLERAHEHYRTGKAMVNADGQIGGEWYAVCLFYSAFHSMTAAMYADPIWWDMRKLQALDGRLQPGMRESAHHKGRWGTNRGPGVNDLVRVLYADLAEDYEDLHMASVMVRYNEGLSPGAYAPEELLESSWKILQESKNGHIKVGLRP